MNQQNWHRINIDVTHAVKIDLKDYILSDPYREGEYALYLEEKAGVWTLKPEIIFEHNFLSTLENDLGVKVDLAQIFLSLIHI